MVTKKRKSNLGGARPGAGRPRLCTVCRAKISKKEKTEIEDLSELNDTDRVNNQLKNASLLDIIDKCKATGVKRFKFGQIELEFGETESPSPPIMALPGQESPQNDELLYSDEDRELLQTYHEQQLMIDDPESFEQNIIDGYQRRETDAQTYDR